MQEQTGCDADTAHGSEIIRPSQLGPAISRARQILGIRRARDRAFAVPGLFSDPAWDILLSIFIDELEGRSVPVKAVYVASGIPPATALRYIGRLEEEGIISSKEDVSSRRRRLLRLTAKGRKIMETLVAH